MSLWDGIASFGLGAQGYNDYNNAQADRDYLTGKRQRDEEVQKIELEKLRRQDDLAKRTRQIASDYGIGGANQLPATQPQDITIPQAVSVDDEGEPYPAATKTVPGLPAAQNTAAMYEAMAQAHEANGHVAEAANIRKAAEQMKNEGYTDLLKGVVAGEEPSAIAQRFNRKGDHRIVDGARQGDSYTFTYDNGRTQTVDKNSAQDLGTRLGIFKKDLTIVPQGATAIDGSGAVVATGQPKVRNIDPLSPEGIAAHQQMEAYKASLIGKDATPAKIREVKAIADLAFNGDTNAAIGFVYGMRDKPRSEQVLHLAKLYTDDGDKPDAAVKKAEAQIDRLHSADSASRGGKSPTADAAPDVQRDIETAARRAGAASSAPPKGYPDAKRSPIDGKWYVQKPDGYYLVKE